MSKFFNILFNKNIIAPPLSWKTSSLGSSANLVAMELRQMFKPNKIVKEFYNVMWAKPNAKTVEKVCDKFEKATGVKMIMTDTHEAHSFCELENVFMRDIRKGRFPKDIKYIIFGHGAGSSLVQTGADRWHVGHKPEIGIFDFIKQHVPKGEKVIVNCCEVTPKKYRHLIPKNKPAIGFETSTDASSSYYHPLKIVRSGEDRIIGAYANGIATMY